VVHFVFSGVIS